MDLPPKSLRTAARRLICRRGHSVTAVSRATGINRSRLSGMLNGRNDLTAAQWRTFWGHLGVWEMVLECMRRAAEEETA